MQLTLKSHGQDPEHLGLPTFTAGNQTENQMGEDCSNQTVYIKIKTHNWVILTILTRLQHQNAYKLDKPLLQEELATVQTKLDQITTQTNIT